MFKRLFAFTLLSFAAGAGLRAEPIAPLIAELNASDYDARQTARLSLRQTLVDASAEELQRHEAELLQAIGPDQDWATREWCLRLLELVGTRASVAGLAGLLNDPDARIRDLARRALAAIPHNQAIDALAQASLQAPPAEQAAYADALAYRGDARAVKGLTTLLQRGSVDAALALGKIGNRAAQSALKKAHARANGELKIAIELAFLDSGTSDRRLVTQLAQTGQTPAVQVSAFARLAELDARAAKKLLDAILAQPEDERRALVLRHALAQPRLRDQVVERLPGLPEAEQIVVLEAVADLNLTQYEAATLQLLEKASETLRPVVLGSLGRIGTDASFEPLLERYLADPRDRAASGALARLQAPSADRGLFATARGDGPIADRVAAVRLLVVRNTDGAVDLLNTFAGVTNPPELRNEAFRGLEVVGDLASVRLLLELILKDDPLKRAAQGSLKRLSANLGVPDALWQTCYAPALQGATDDQKRDILVIIDGISGPEAAAWLQQVAVTGQPLQAEALDALRRWTDISGVDAWVAIAQAPGANPDTIAQAKQSIVRILGSTRTTGLNGAKVERAAKAMEAFPDDSAFRRDILAVYQGELHWQTRRAINQHFPTFRADPAIAADLEDLLARTRFN